MVQLQQHSIAQEAMDINLSKVGYTAYYVDGTKGLNTYPGDSWEQPFKTVQHAVDEGESWCKIFVKAGTYAENVAITKQGIHITGEKASTVIIKPATGQGIVSSGENTTVETLTSVGNGTGSANAAIYFSGKYSTAKNVVVGNQNSAGYGVVTAEQYGICDGILIDQSNKPGGGIWFESWHGEIANCIIENVGEDGIVLAESSCKWNKVHDNTIIDAGRYGIFVFGLGADYNTIYHNNIVNATTANARDTSGNTNRFFENFYADHTDDVNNCGLCDSAYSFTTGYDYQPVSRRNGWNQRSLPTLSKPDVFSKLTKTITLGTGATPVTESLFWVTGEIECYVLGFVDTTVLSGGALTISVGVSGAVDSLIPTTPKGNLLSGRVWVDATAASCRPSPAVHTISNGSNILHYIDVAAATNGAITYYCWWRPLSSDGNVLVVT